MIEACRNSYAVSLSALWIEWLELCMYGHIHIQYSIQGNLTYRAASSLAYALTYPTYWMTLIYVDCDHVSLEVLDP